MNTKLFRILAIVFAALAMGMHLAHALELLPKLRWQPELYIAVQSSLYTLFGTIGPVLEIGALVLVSLLARKLWMQPSQRRLVLASAGCIAAALLAWAAFVLPANAHLAAWAAGSGVPGDWERWRNQWQFGQAFIFVLHIMGFTSLVAASVRHE